MRVENTRVDAVRELAEGIFELTVCAPEICAEPVRPGQFANLALGDESRLLSRPISVRSVIGDRIVFDIQRAGEGTRRLGALKPGDALRVTGWLGNGFEWDDANGDYILVGGGIGLAPILFLRERMHASARLIAGFRSARLAYGVDSGDVIVTTEDGSLGEKGYVTAPLAREIERKRPDCVMACGPTPMLRAVQQLCAQYGVSAKLSLEERMGCGVGACLTCPCKVKANTAEGFTYKRVCADGPVFDAQEVIF